MLKLELMLADRRSATLVQQSGPSSWSAAFAPDGSLIRAGVGEIRGRDALHEAFMSDIQSGAVAALEWLPDRAEVSRDGVLGYTVGQYATLGVDSDGVRTVERGRYVRIWERQPDGEWKVDIEIRTPTGEPEADTPPAGELEP
jgi:ketosteroid isomerase-like protein